MGEKSINIVVGIGGQESEASTGQYPADHVASYASQHKKGLPVDRYLKGRPVLHEFFVSLHCHLVGYFPPQW